MNADIAEKQQEMIALRRRHGVRRLDIFGSAARRTDFDSTRSDADFLVEFDRESDASPLQQFFGFAAALETTIGRPVDLVERGALLNPFILASIEQARELVYAA